VILRSFGKFWGLAGLRLGWAFCGRETAARLRDLLGPWPVSGPALALGAEALADRGWAEAARARLGADAAALDALMAGAGARRVGGTALFRLYDAEPATWARLARARILARRFPYAPRWLRVGPPGTDADRARLAEALA
jgi:cobalamin biosynthetic protein CobC